MTLTFGECAENHVGNQQLGSIAASGFSVSELRAAGEKFAARGCVVELVDLSVACSEAPEAAVLVIRSGPGLVFCRDCHRLLNPGFEM